MAPNGCFEWSYSAILFFRNYWNENKAIEAKIYFHENQIHLIKSHKIYHLHFLKERLRTGEMREPSTTFSASDYLNRI